MPELLADVQYIDPLEQPSEYGGEELLADLTNVRHIEGEGPQVGHDLTEALQTSDFDSAESHLPPIRDWFSRREDRYTVLDSGTVRAKIPVLVAEAADVPDLELTASQARSAAAGGEVTLKVAGTGVGTSAKITVSDSLKLTCSAGERIVASVMLPVHWERRAHPGNEDYNWLHIEVSRGDRSLPITVEKVNSLADVRTLSTLVVDNRDGGAKPTSISRSFAMEMGADFSIGLTVEAIGLDTSLKVVAEASLTNELEAALPSGHRYQIAWLGGPWGVQVSTIR